MTLGRPTAATGAVSLPDIEFVCALVRRTSSVLLEPSKGYLVSSRLLPLARREGLESVSSLIATLRARPFGRLHDATVEALVISETSFFRDYHPFEALREQILPELIRARRGTSRSLTVWSAACSTGQEPYSLAMLILEHFPVLRDWQLNLIASDLSKSALDRARQGLYHQHEVNRGLPARQLVRFFLQERTMWRLRDEVRGMWRFFPHNLSHDWESIPRVDLLLLRNALIYFDVDTRRNILRRVRRVLSPDGYLLLGGAETTFSLDEGFSRVQVGRSVFYQVKRDHKP